MNGREGFFSISKNASPFRYTSLVFPVKLFGYCNLLSAFSHTLLPSARAMVLFTPLAFSFCTRLLLSADDDVLTRLYKPMLSPPNAITAAAMRVNFFQT